MRALLAWSVIACLLTNTAGPRAEPRWLTLPRTPGLPRATVTGFAPSDGARIWYSVFGQGQAVTLLHGGLANSNYWGFQVSALSRRFKVVLIDSRGHGRSTNDGRPYSYVQMVRDTIAVLDRLGIRRTSVVGWSDGAIIGLYLAFQHPRRVDRLFAFAGNYSPSGVRDVSGSLVFKAYFERTEREYKALSSTPSRYPEFLAAITKMWKTQPNLQPNELQKIQVPVWIADGDRDEAIERAHTEGLAALIPDAGLLIQPQVSHFSFLQAPDEFNAAILHFLDKRHDARP